MRCWIIIILVTAVFFGCHPKKEMLKDAPEHQPDITVVQQTEEFSTISELADSEHQEGLKMTDEILAEYGKLLSGSWTDFPEKVDGERELSWGPVPFANQSYTLIDFVAEQPVYIMGMSEGGPIGFDNLRAKVKKIEIEAEDTFRIYYYDDSSSFGTHEGDFVIHYDNENDTIELTELGGRNVSPSLLEYRVSEKLSE